MKYVLLTFVALLCAGCGSANQSGDRTGGAADRSGPAPTIAITGGTVYTLGAAGKIENGTVLIKDGRISAVGSNVEIPADAERIDATGKVVTPGIFDPESQLGLVEVSAVEETRDGSLSDTRFSAAFDVGNSINPESVHFPIARLMGVTRAMVAPMAAQKAGHIIAGQGAVIGLGSSAHFILRDPAAMFAVVGETGARLAGGSRTGALLTLRSALQEAKDYAGNKSAYEKNQTRHYTLSQADLEAVQPVLKGAEPLVIQVNRASDIREALRLAKDFKLKLIVSGGAEGWMVADELAAAKVPVLLNPLEDLPQHFETMGATLENAARLQKAGVMIAFTSVRVLTQGAGNAVAYGLPWDEALKALMLNPAKIFGVDADLGSLEAGKIADVVVWSGDPLELSSHTEQVIVAGEKMPMESRQTLLRDRYLQEIRKTDALPAGYIHPVD